VRDQHDVVDSVADVFERDLEQAQPLREVRASDGVQLLEGRAGGRRFVGLLCRWHAGSSVEVARSIPKSFKAGSTR
jgi:hypothetical protein